MGSANLKGVANDFLEIKYFALQQKFRLVRFLVSQRLTERLPDDRRKFTLIMVLELSDPILETFADLSAILELEALRLLEAIRHERPHLLKV